MPTYLHTRYDYPLAYVRVLKLFFFLFEECMTTVLLTFRFRQAFTRSTGWRVTDFGKQKLQNEKWILRGHERRVRNRRPRPNLELSRESLIGLRPISSLSTTVCRRFIDSFHILLDPMQPSGGVQVLFRQCDHGIYRLPIPTQSKYIPTPMLASTLSLQTYMLDTMILFFFGTSHLLIAF